jgi:uncharacterized membrane protein HdeD (DUF308 family)
MTILLTTNIMTIFDVILIGYGIYTIFSAVKMKRTRKPGEWLLGPVDIDESKDMNGFIDEMYIKTVVFGIAIFISGVIATINDYFLKQRYVYFIGVAIFLIGATLYIIFLNKAKKKYLS